MTHGGYVNSQLEAELREYHDGVTRGIRNLLGGGEGVELSEDVCPLLGYLFVHSEILFRSYFITTRALFVFEMDTKNATLGITIPVRRLRRISELKSEGHVRVSCEFDADTTRLAGSGRLETLGDGGQGFSLNIEQRTASIEWAEVEDTDAAMRLGAFTRALRTVLVSLN